MADDDIRKILRRLERLSGLTAREVNALLALGQVGEAAAGAVIMDETEQGRDYLLTLEGELEARRIRPGTPAEVVERVPPGGFVRRRARVVALQPSRYLRLDGDRVDDLLAWYHHFGGNPEGQVRQRMELVRNGRALARLPPGNAEVAAERLRPVNVRAGDRVVRQGDPAFSYFILEEGQAQVQRCGGDGLVRILAELEPGMGFGEDGLLTGEPRNASVVMLSDGRIWTLDREDFEELVKAPLIEEVEAGQAEALVDSGRARWLDCRHEFEYRADGLPGAVTVPLPELRGHIAALDPAVTWICYCSNGRRAQCAAFLLRQQGLSALVLRGGLRDWPDPIEG